jgi:hypothetical protein
VVEDVRREEACGGHDMEVSVFVSNGFRIMNQDGSSVLSSIHQTKASHNA